jgi:hypothetical protein
MIVEIQNLSSARRGNIGNVVLSLRFLITGLLVLAHCATAQFLPVSAIRPGLRGTGYTVFSGDRVEPFEVEFLGVLENIGPKQSLILARLSGGPLERTGVMQGMSGSPVYVDGKLVGAVAMSFPFSKEPIAGIRPIEEMLKESAAGPAAKPRQALVLPGEELTRHWAKRTEIAAGEARLVDIATPVAFSGFTRTAVEHFAPQLRALGLEPAQGVSGGGAAKKAGAPAQLKPGSMITVQLMTGDMSVGADGTVTHIDGNKIYAFGHRFLSAGDTAMPFARAEVLTLLPSISSSFKISTTREWMGTITQDRSTVVAGELGRACAMVPLDVRVSRRGVAPVSNYHMEIVNDRVLTPFLLQMAIFSTIDATERSLGASRYRVSGRIELQDGMQPIEIRNIFAGDFNVPALVSLAAAVPLSYALQSGFDTLNVRNIRLEVEAFDDKKQAQIDEVTVSKSVVRPGESVELNVTLAGENGTEIVRKSQYTVPSGATPGALYFTVADGNATNMLEFRGLLSAPPKSAAQVIAFLNGLRPSSAAYVRVWRPEASFQVQGEELPNPPASVSMILNRAQGSVTASGALRNAKLAEIVLDADGAVVAGSKTVQVEIKE